MPHKTESGYLASWSKLEPGISWMRNNEMDVTNGSNSLTNFVTTLKQKGGVVREWEEAEAEAEEEEEDKI